MSKAEKRCCDCIHYSACAAWNVGSIAGMKCDHCVNYERDNSSKCADQMFRDLGYKAEDESYAICNEKWFRKKTDEGAIVICVDFDTKSVICKMSRSEVPMSFEETLACAQLIKETEADNE